ncbi:PDZ domain-containing protein [Streptomyces armeniacus]|uniref:PDZ domain-containing protein n=2 Tax=Streptomyces armeniacus TaxID=83291 RepID=A0A345Y0V1_9ACTN|nr:PDZ domain-containing protein [Streptomyces armeniacus]
MADTPTATAAEPPEGRQWGTGGGYSGAGAPPPPPGGGYGGPGDGGAGHGGQAGHGAGPGGPQNPQNPWNAPPPPPPGGGRRRGPGALIAAVIVAALVAGGIGGGIGFWAADDDSSGSTTVSSDADAGSKALNRSPKSVAGIADKALPSVVTIETAGGQGATGTGFVFDEQGHILTNNHVVAGAAGGGGGKLTATFSDGKSYDAEVVGNAKGYDIAVIKLKDAGDRELAPLPLGNSEKMKVGDATIAIGAPFGLSGTVTTGIVSAQDRPVASSDGQGADASYMNALQTDASINPGNSGGPLLNASGAVIGVNSAIRGSDGGMGQGQSGSIGLGFAIPVNQAKRVATQLIDTGVPVYPVIGVRVGMGEKAGGATIIDEGTSGAEPVTKGGPADKAGLKPGDTITKFNDRAIDSGPTLIATIWAHKPGETVKVTYERDGKEQTADLTLGSQKGDD